MAGGRLSRSGQTGMIAATVRPVHLFFAALAAATLAGTSSRGALGADPRAAQWQQLLQTDVASFPQIASAAEQQAAGEPGVIEVAFVSGAIGGRNYPPACALVRSDPRGFAREARTLLLPTGGDRDYIHAQGLTVHAVVAAYVRGVLFGCNQ